MKSGSLLAVSFIDVNVFIAGCKKVVMTVPVIACLITLVGLKVLVSVILSQGIGRSHNVDKQVNTYSEEDKYKWMVYVSRIQIFRSRLCNVGNEVPNSQICSQKLNKTLTRSQSILLRLIATIRTITDSIMNL